jgi:hypothetical protein
VIIRSAPSPAAKLVSISASRKLDGGTYGHPTSVVDPIHWMLAVGTFVQLMQSAETSDSA